MIQTLQVSRIAENTRNNIKYGSSVYLWESQVWISLRKEVEAYVPQGKIYTKEIKISNKD